VGLGWWSLVGVEGVAAVVVTTVSCCSRPWGTGDEWPWLVGNGGGGGGREECSGGDGFLACFVGDENLARPCLRGPSGLATDGSNSNSTLALLKKPSARQWIFSIMHSMDHEDFTTMVVSPPYGLSGMQGGR
jgi:hypothetical protein